MTRNLSYREAMREAMHEALAKIGEQLEQETQKLSEIREAIAIEKKNMRKGIVSLENLL